MSYESVPRYVLDESGEPVVISDVLEWCRWRETADRHVAADEIGSVGVSTVFLGLDHGWWPGGPPVLWETMAFVAGKDIGRRFNTLGQRRYTSRADALRGHAEIVAEVHRLRADGKLAP